MQQAWLIDGYNLFHALKDRSGPIRVRTKVQLLELLASFAGTVKRPFLAVFDGIGPDDEYAPYRTEHFNAVNSQKVPADAYIERLLFEGRQKTAYQVVTEDRAIAGLARGTGARVYSAIEFISEMNDNSRDRDETLRKNDVRSRRFNRPFGDKL